jgi:nucleotide-binding universal stress UspA family protein
MTVSAVRRITVGVDGSAESLAALLWACREAPLRGAQVHVVHVREARCHNLASYAVPAAAPPNRDDFTADSIEDLVRSVQADQAPDADIRVEVADGLAARVLLDRCAGADMLVLGTASDTPGAGRPVGPVIRACLRRAPCPVVVISAAQDLAQRREGPARAPAAAAVPAAAGV